MKRLTFFVLLIFFLFPLFSGASAKNILNTDIIRTGKIDFLVQLVPENVKLLPGIDDREAWQQVLPEKAKEYINRALEYADYEWPTLKATDYLAFERDGSRSAYEQEFFLRRRILNILVIAECIENKGRFLDPITDGIWAILSEPSWVVPAHKGLTTSDSSYFPRTGLHTLDLFSAETGSTLVLIMQMMGDKLEKNAPGLTRWVQVTISRRLLQPLYERNDWWWMGFSNLGNHQINNWNPWVNSNLLKCILLNETDTAKRRYGISLLLNSMDQYLNRYPDDGGCDEGPSYWSLAAGTLFDALNTLYIISDGSINVFHEPLVKNMGAYSYKMHIADEWVVNFADASARHHQESPYIVYEFGKRCKDSVLMQYGAFLARQAKGDPDLGRSYLTQRMVLNLLSEKEMLSAVARQPNVSHAWFPGIEVFVAREKAGAKEGFFIAAKGGHNNESHNHNDVGNFVVFLDGKPLIIDAGSAVYTKFTFGSKRYTLWNNQSAFHNLPSVNGCMQPPGVTYRADSVLAHFSDVEAAFSLHLKSAYPDSAMIRCWKRNFLLSFGKSIYWRDSFALQQFRDTTFLHLLLAYPPSISKNGDIVLTNGEAKVKLVYSKDKLKVFSETIDLTYDANLSRNWGKNIHRLIFMLSPTVQDGNLEFELLR